MKNMESKSKYFFKYVKDLQSLVKQIKELQMAKKSVSSLKENTEHKVENFIDKYKQYSPCLGDTAS